MAMKRICSAALGDGLPGARHFGGGRVLNSMSQSPGSTGAARRLASSNTGSAGHNDTPAKQTDSDRETSKTQTASAQSDTRQNKDKKTTTQLDQELRSKLEDMSGEGGAAGVEYENGVAEGLKDGVKRNMFRLI